MSKRTLVYPKDVLLSFRSVYTSVPDNLKEISITVDPPASNRKHSSRGPSRDDSSRDSSRDGPSRGSSQNTQNRNHRGPQYKKNRKPVSPSKHPPAPPLGHPLGHPPTSSQRDWEVLNDIRTICNSKTSFTNRMKEQTDSDKFLGSIRGLLNKITDQTFTKIKTSLEELEMIDELMIQVADIYIKKITHDSVYAELYGQSGVILCKKFANLGNDIQECVKVTFETLTKDPIMDDVNKIKIINLIKWLPYGCEMDVIKWDKTDNDVISIIIKKIETLTSDENIVNTYADAILSQDLGVWIEMACAIITVCATTKRNIEHYTLLVSLITVLKNDTKHVKARIRFMIEDVIKCLTH